MIPKRKHRYVFVTHRWPGGVLYFVARDDASTFIIYSDTCEKTARAVMRSLENAA